MNDAIITALITGGLSLAGVVISNLAAGRKTEQSIRVSQAVSGAQRRAARQCEKQPAHHR